MAQVSRTGLEGVGEEPISKPLQPPAVLWGDGVPGFGRPEVEVVDAVRVEWWLVEVVNSVKVK